MNTLQKVQNIIIHSGYSDYTLYRDIALVKLTTPVPAWTDYIQPACIRWANDDAPQVNDDVYVIGFGNTENDGDASDVLLGVELTVYSNAFCDDVLGGTHDESQICAGYIPGGKDSCQVRGSVKLKVLL